MAFKVFFSYAHRDEQLLEKLKEHLAPLKNQGLIDRLWYDREISAGNEWEPEIVRHLETADIILLLVSSAFMNSDYCFGKELQRAIQRHERREARVVPVILSPVDWQIPPLNKLQALPTDGKPATGAGWHSVDEAFLNVAKGLRTVIKDLQHNPKQGSSYQYHINYIHQELAKGRSALTALRQCDPDLAQLFDMLVSTDVYTEPLQARIEKMLEAVAPVGDGDLRVHAEVTPDTLGNLADAFNYSVEELIRVISSIFKTNSIFSSQGNQILKTVYELEQRSKKLDEVLKDENGRYYDLEYLDLDEYVSDAEFIVGTTEKISKEVRNLMKLIDDLRASVATFRLPENPNPQV